jgi:hypothetical protein
VSPFTIDAGLNLLWLGISVAALVWFAQRERTGSNRVCWHRLLAVFLATVALFPAVSDTDDLFSFSRLQIPGRHHGAGTAPEDSREKDSLQLARHFESLDQSQVSAFYSFALSLCFVALLLTLSLACPSRPVLASAGRAPPLA